MFRNKTGSNRFRSSDMVDDEMLNDIGDFGINRTKFLFDFEEERIFNSGIMLDQVTFKIHFFLIIIWYSILSYYIITHNLKVVISNPRLLPIHVLFIRIKEWTKVCWKHRPRMYLDLLILRKDETLINGILQCELGAFQLTNPQKCLIKKVSNLTLI